jgi:peptidoglycan/LPS O-acetylase OafA/YrhL
MLTGDCRPVIMGASTKKFMLPEKKTATNIGIGVGIVLQILRLVLVAQGIVSPHWGLLIYAVGLVFFIWGCMNYAEGKGSSKWFGLLGLLSILGLAVLIFLPDQHKQPK